MEELVKENQALKEKILELEDKLEKYMFQHKKYYELNKNIIIEKANNRLKKINEDNPEKIKEYRRRAYLKKKEKMKNEEIKEN